MKRLLFSSRKKKHYLNKVIFFNKQRLHNDARIFIQINSRKHTQNNLKKRILYHIYLDCTISDVGKRKIKTKKTVSLNFLFKREEQA